MVNRLKGVILAGGKAKRLYPLTLVTNKQLLPVYNKPMIYYPLQTLKDAGIADILIVTSKEHGGSVFALMGSGKEFGVKFTYRIQDEPGGLPQAIALAEDFVGKDRFVSINGDNLLFEPIKQHVKEFEDGNEESRILLLEDSKEECQKAGVAIIEGEKIIGFVEKPKEPPSNLLSIGVYMYTPQVFEVIRTLKPSARGELEITDLHNYYIKRGTLKASIIKGPWHDAGSIEELLAANNFAKKYYEKTNGKK